MKFAAKCKRQVFPSAVASANYRRAGVPAETSVVISSGVDADRFKPDDAARERVRTQLELPKDAIVVGMYAPFQPEYDHSTLLKGIGELTKINPNIYCVLAGRAIARGNSALMAMVGGGTLGTRTRVIGEWTDLSALFNACDVVCSTATVDAARLHLAMAMLCGTMCVATGIGAQGEVLGNFGVSIEPGSPEAVTRGIRRLIEMPADRKAFMALEARKHALQNFNMTRSIEKYHELYAELVGGEAPAASAVNAAAADAIPVNEAVAQDPQQLLIAEIIAKRAAAMSARAHAKAAPAEEKPKVAEVESATSFGSVAASPPKKAPAAEVVSAVTSEKDSQEVAPKTESTSEATPETKAETKPESKAEIAQANDSIDFESYINAPSSQDKASGDQDSSKDSAHWSDDDAKLMEDVLVAADPLTAKANADKAAGAAKAAAAKAAASAALVAALSAGGDSAAALDPKLVAALNLSNSNRSRSSGPRVVAGKPPPTPAAEKSALAAQEKMSEAKLGVTQNSPESLAASRAEDAASGAAEGKLDKAVGV